MRYFIEFSYNGKNYYGWQNQPNAVSVQEFLENALSTLLRENIQVVGAGRTDSGVHAKQMFAHFDTCQHFEAEKLVHKLNSFLPKDIAIFRVFKVLDNAHARFDAVKRTYEYHISTRKNVFNYQTSMHVNLPLSVDKMNVAAEILLKHTDFQCFSKSNTDVFTYNCEIYEAFWKKTMTC